MIDAHHHLWNYQPKKHQWIDDTMTVIRRDFTGDDLSLMLSRNGITGTVLVQVDQLDAGSDWLIQSEPDDFLNGKAFQQQFILDHIANSDERNLVMYENAIKIYNL